MSLLKRLVLIFLILCVSAYGQVQRNASIIIYPGVPTGTCSSQATFAMNGSNGDLYECPSTTWVKFAPATGVAPNDATYITQTPNATLTNEQALSILGTGLLKSTSGTGVISIAIGGTDYENPLTFNSPLTRSVNTISCQTASGTQAGCLSSTDWTNFNTTSNNNSVDVTLAPGSENYITLVGQELAIHSVNLSTGNVTGINTVGRGGTGSDLSATGGTSKVLRQSSAGANVTVSQLACGDLSDAAGGCTSSAGITQLTGDVTAGPGSGSQAATVVKVDGVSYPSGPSTNTVPVVTGSNTVTYEAVPNTALANSAITINGTSVSLGGTRSLTLNSSDFANEGTTTTVLHGAAAGNPSFASVVSADLNITTTTCTNQFIRSLSSGAVGTCATVANADLANSSISVSATSNQTTVSGSPVSLGGTVTIGTVQDIGTGSSPTFAGLTDSGLTSGRVPIASTGGLLADDADLTFSTDTLTATKIVGSTSITDSGLTSGRVTVASTSGLLSDSANLTWSSPTLKIGVATSTTGALQMTGSTSGTVTETVANAAGTWTFTLPTTGGTANYAMTTDGSGTASWVSGQSIAGLTTSSTPQFARLGLNVAADGTTSFITSNAGSFFGGFRSSSYTNPFTTSTLNGFNAESIGANTFGSLSPWSAAGGGFFIIGSSNTSGVAAVGINAHHGVEDTSVGAIRLNAAGLSGASPTALGNTSILLSVQNNSTNKFTILGNGSTTLTSIADPSDTSKTIALSLSGMTTAKTLTLSSSQSTSQTLTIPNITQASTIAIQPQTASSTNYTCNTTATGGDMCGNSISITPRITGKLFIAISGQATNGTGDDGFQYDIRYGTGTAPSDGNALAGTQCGSTVQGSAPTTTSVTTTVTLPFSHQCIVSGLTVGTAYWIELGIYAVTGGTATFASVNASAFEL